MPTTPVLYDMHMHTPLCKHARGEPEEYAAIAHQRGLKGIVFTCHNPDNNGWSPNVRMDISQLQTYIDMVERARQTWAGRVDVRLGLECDYIPGMEPWLKELLSMADFHHILGSVHPHIKAYRELFWTGDPRAFVSTYFEHLAMAAETGLFDTLAHPDLVKNVVYKTWNVEEVMEIIRPALDRIATAGTCMELNTSGILKTCAEMNPGPLMLREMKQRQIPVVIGSDSHDPFRVSASFEDALDTLSACGYTHSSIVLDRQPQAIPINTSRPTLRPLPE